MVATEGDNADAGAETRVSRVPRRGARVAFLLAALMVVGAVYFLFVPLGAPTQGGGLWRCGTVLKGPQDAFGSTICGGVRDLNLARAVGLAAAAAVTASGGLAIFGFDRSIQLRARRDEDAEDF